MSNSGDDIFSILQDDSERLLAKLRSTTTRRSAIAYGDLCFIMVILYLVRRKQRFDMYLNQTLLSSVLLFSNLLVLGLMVLQ